MSADFAGHRKMGWGDRDGDVICPCRTGKDGGEKKGKRKKIWEGEEDD
jgi:hypothetical protein